MKKKILAVCILAAMVLSLAACGGGNDKPTGAVSEQTEAAVQEATEAAPAEVETTAQETEPEKDFQMGSTKNLVYENEYLNIGCKLPQGWSTYDEEQIAEVNGFVLDNVGDDLKDQISNSSMIYDMMAASEDEMQNVNIIVQNLNILQSLANVDMEEAVKASEEQIITTFEGMGITNLEFKIDRGVTFPADNYAAAVVTGELQGFKLTERLVLFKVGSYLANVTVTAVGDDTTQDILSSFYALH